MAGRHGKRHPIHILLVEDDPEDVRTIWNMLRERSRYVFHLEAVNRLPEALRWLEKNSADVVLLDLALSTHDAERDTIRAIQQVRPHVAIIVLTTLEDEDAGLEALELGAQDYLLKEEIGTRGLIRSLQYAVERKRSETILSDSEEKYRILAELSPDAILVSIDGCYVYANAAAGTLMGAHRLEDITGRSVGDFLSPEDREQVYARMAAMLETKEPVTARGYALKRLDGSTIEVEVSAAAITWQESPAILVHMRDVTERKQFEVQRESLLAQEQTARQEAERAVGLQRLFLGMVSHELRTPLASIKGFSSSLLANDVAFDPEQTREFLEIIDSEADRLTALIDQLMDVVQAQAGSLRVEPAVVRVADIIRAVTPQLTTLAAKHLLTVDLADSLPPVKADGLRVGQVLVNLVSNAVKFSPPDTVVCISAVQVDEWMEVCVRDRGNGIPEDEHDRVFDVFYQAAAEGGRKPGTGLGLAIARGLIKAHGGCIWVRESNCQGTTVAFTLPLAGLADSD